MKLLLAALLAQTVGGGGILDLSPFALKTDVPALAPVQAVNGAQGQVTVPTVQRQVSGPLDATSGVVSWTFPNTFSNMPTCWTSINQADTTYVFGAPVITTLTQTGVTVGVRSAKVSINLLGLGLLTVWNNPPAGSTLSLSCVGALP